MLINNSFTAFQNLLNLIADANPISGVINTDQVTLSSVTTLTPTQEDPRNSQITLTAVPDKGFVGSAVVRYKRLDLSIDVNMGTQDININENTTLEGILNYLSTAYGLVKESLQLTGALPSSQGATTNIVLSATTDSILYVSSKNLTASWSAEDANLLLFSTLQNGSTDLVFETPQL